MVLKTIAVTGSSGMLGRHIASRLKSDGFNVIPLTRSKTNNSRNSRNWDLMNFASNNELDILFSDVDIVVHAGAAVPGLQNIYGNDELLNINSSDIVRSSNKSPLRYSVSMPAQTKRMVLQKKKSILWKLKLNSKKCKFIPNNYIKKGSNLFIKKPLFQSWEILNDINGCSLSANIHFVGSKFKVVSYIIWILMFFSNIGVMYAISKRSNGWRYR